MTILDRADRTEQARAILAAKEAELQKLAEVGARTLEAQKQAERANELEHVHTLGVDDGLAAALKKSYAYGDGVTVPPGVNITNEEVQKAKELYGVDSVDAKDIDNMRKLETLEKINNGSIAPRDGLAAQTVQGV